MNLLNELNETFPVTIHNYWEVDPLFGFYGEGWNVNVNSGWRVLCGDKIIEWDDDSDRDGWLDGMIGQRIVSAAAPEPGKLILTLSECRIELWDVSASHEICVIRFPGMVRVIDAEMLRVGMESSEG